MTSSPDQNPGAPLHSLVLSYLEDPEITLAPDDPVGEARINTWCYSFAAGSVDVDAVVSALRFVAAELRTRSTNPRGTFYVWFDAQAGQLRCSLSSASPGQLPFAGPYHLVDDPAGIVATAAAEGSPGILPREELHELLPEEEHEHSWPGNLDRPPGKPFPIWAVELSA